MFDIKHETQKLLKGCIMKSDSGINMYTPDGKATYAAFWTRDFAYMIENASDLIPLKDIKLGIQYLIDGADENGWIPDRVEKNGTARYTAGFGFPALPNLDNGCFLILAVDGYLNLLDEREAKEKFWGGMTHFVKELIVCLKMRTVLLLIILNLLILPIGLQIQCTKHDCCVLKHYFYGMLKRRFVIGF